MGTVRRLNGRWVQLKVTTTQRRPVMPKRPSSMVSFWLASRVVFISPAALSDPAQLQLDWNANDLTGVER